MLELLCFSTDFDGNLGDSYLWNGPLYIFRYLEYLKKIGKTAWDYVYNYLRETGHLDASAQARHSKFWRYVPNE